MRRSVPLPIQQALVDKDVPPGEHLVDAAYISADLLVQSQTDHGIMLRGPTRLNSSWQSKVEGGYTLDQFTIDWDHQEAWCPQGKRATAWSEQQTSAGQPDLCHDPLSETLRFQWP